MTMKFEPMDFAIPVKPGLVGGKANLAVADHLIVRNRFQAVARVSLFSYHNDGALAQLFAFSPELLSDVEGLLALVAKHVPADTLDYNEAQLVKNAKARTEKCRAGVQMPQD